METLLSIKNKMHSASCSDLSALLTEANSILATNLDMVPWARSHIYREYNRRKFILCAGADMMEPYDSGFRPVGPISFVTESVILLEDGSNLLLEDGSNLLLES